MNLRSLAVVFILVFWAGLVHAAAQQNPGIDQLTPVMSHYLQELKRVAASANPSQLQYIKAEQSRVQAAMREVSARYKLEKATAIVQQQKVVTKPHVPKTHILETYGIAGAPVFTKNNIYTFNLKETGPKSQLVFYASGRKSIKTYGKVWLITPANQRFRIHKWSPRDFNRPLSDAKTYKRLKPVSVDISDMVSKPGTYKIEFDYTDGIDALGIMRVELTS